MEEISTVNSLDSSYPNLEDSTAFARIQWAKNTFGDSLVMSTSFGIQSTVLLHLVTQQIPNIPIIFIDTGYLFPETYSLAEDLTKLLKLNLLTYLSSHRKNKKTDMESFGSKGRKD